MNQALNQTYQTIDTVLSQVNDVVLGKGEVVKRALSCLLARGHLLIEDSPGVGKTTLAHTLAKTLGLSFQRIQFTSDMLPADILGVSIFEREPSAFRFHPGPIFHQLVLADEINRATPRTQSALLEAMEEHQVTVDGETHRLPQPFFVIATQNPANQIGTFELPESQLDRFMMRLHIGFPDARAERALLTGRERRDMLEDMQPAITAEQLRELQTAVSEVQVSEHLIDYVQQILLFTRESGWFNHGLSPRAGLGIVSTARSWALIHHRDHVLPEDVQAVVPYLVGHRLQLRDQSKGDDWPEALIKQIAVPH